MRVMNYFAKCNHASDEIACPVCLKEATVKLEEVSANAERFLKEARTEQKMKDQLQAEVNMLISEQADADDIIRRLKIENEMLTVELEKLKLFYNAKPSSEA